MKFLFPILCISCAFIFVRCDEAPTSETAKEKEIVETFEQRTNREISAILQLPATERYSLKIYREHINNDTLLDAIVTVNRMQYAMNEAIRLNKTVKAEEMGYMGNYNFFFYYDGALDKFSVPIPVPSSPGRELDISFVPITSIVRKDVVIGYRIRNSGWKTYFSVVNEQDLMRVFQWKEFDQLGVTYDDALYHSIEPNEDGLSNDIVLYKGTISNPPKNLKDYYDYVPVIKKGTKVARFFYDPRSAKFGIDPKDLETVRNL